MGNTVCVARPQEGEEVDIHDKQSLQRINNQASSRSEQRTPIEDDPASLKQLISDLNENLSKSNDERDRALKELETLKEDVAAGLKEWEHRLAEKETEVQTLKSENESLKSEVQTQRSNFEAEMTFSQQKAIDLNLVLVRAGEEREALNKDLNDVRGKLEESTAKLSAELKEKETLIAENNALRESERSTEDAHQKKVTQLEEQVQRLRDDITMHSRLGIEATKKCSDIEKAHATLKAEKDSLVQQIENLKKEHAQATKLLLQDNENLLRQKDTEVNEWKQKYEASKKVPVPEPEFIKDLEETKSEEADTEIKDEVVHNAHLEAPHTSEEREDKEKHNIPHEVQEAHASEIKAEHNPE